MGMKFGLITYLVRDYDEAIAYFTDVLKFSLLEDTPLTRDKRWVVVAPPGGPGTALLLAKASDARQAGRVGDQTGGRVAFFLNTDDFEQDYARFAAAGVLFLESPRQEPYGQVVVFKDLYGNTWDLIQHKA